ncbi:MAG: helix-turn-helix domain-containing protein [Rhizobiaceae bacterium]
MLEEFSLGARISDARMGAGLSVEEAAKQIGVKASTFKNWESGESSPRANRLPMLCGLLNVSLIWLLDGRSDLDPLERSFGSFEYMRQKIERIKELHLELANAIADLEQEISMEKDRSDNLERLAEEEQPD